MGLKLFLVLAASLLCLSCSGKKSEEKAKSFPEIPVSRGPDLRPAIVAFGDSLTAGAGVPASLAYPAKLQEKIEDAGYEYKVVNAGVSGDTSAQGLNRVQSVIAMNPKIVIVEFGANDGLRGMPVETIAGNIVAIVSRLQASGARVILAGMQIPPNYGPQYTRAFQKIFPSVAEKYDAALLPFFLEGVGGHQEFNQEDGIHPTAEGYEIIVENVWKVLKPML